MRYTTRALLALLTIAHCLPVSIARAQGTGAPPEGPVAGSWGAEGQYFGGGGASLLHFSSPRAAWMMTASVAGGRGETSQVDLYGTSRSTAAFFSTLVQVGRRWYFIEPGVSLRPLAGVGVLGGYSAADDSHAWSAGSYGELGATYMFSPHASLGATGQLNVRKSKNRQTFTGGYVVRDDWTVNASVAHLIATVYF